MTSTKPEILLLGHRGARLSAPENTLAAFDLALANGCHGFEFDVRRTKDQRAIICHDPKLGRLSVARSSYEKLISKMLPSASALEAPCGLEQVLERYAGKAFLDIELKVGGLEEIVVSSLKGVDRSSFVVSSFRPRVLQRVRKLDSSIPLGWIFDKRFLRAQWKKMDCEFVIPHWKVLDQKLLRTIHEAGRKALTWTVNEKAEMLRFAAMGVDGIISDDTELLSSTLAGKRKKADSVL